MDPALISEVQRLVRDLSCGRYAEIVADGRGGRLTAPEFSAAIRDYDGRLVPLPDEAIALITAYPHAGSDACSLDVPLWTEEEGRSDLTLLLTVRRQMGRYCLIVDDLRVL